METTSHVGASGAGSVVIQRLHRMVRHGYRPWLGYDVASGQDGDIHLRRKDGVATISADGTVAFAAADGTVADRAMSIAGDDRETFDARFPANTRNKRNLMRRLYEMGF